MPAANAADAKERPLGPRPNGAGFGSDVIAATLRDITIPYVALNPGASFRGLHDSLVNFLGNEKPQTLLCLHEEHAVSIAHGYAKVTGRPMAAAVHSNVGLMHATMAIFNAWCDRAPVVVLGATGPVDAARRRPWIDWIHTAADQGALVRNYVKWDDQPTSPAAAREALLRGAWIAGTRPMGPVYINFDAEMQEEPLAAPLPPTDTARHLVAPENGLSEMTARRLAALCAGAKRPVVLAGRVSRSEEAWAQRIALAERIGARVVGDLKIAAAFPTDHPLYAGDLRGTGGARARDVLARADLVLALDWVDLAGALRAAFGETEIPTIVRVGTDHHVHNGWSMDHQAHPPADIVLACDPEPFVEALLPHLAEEARDRRPEALLHAMAPSPERATIGVETLARSLYAALDGAPSTLTHVPLSWDGAYWPFSHPLDFLGSDGGGGLGAGPGHAIGAALALRDMGSERLPVAVCGDGDFLMGVTALWTAVHYRIPLLMVVANNRSFFNDEVHQEKVARMRGRPVENKWIGMRMADPEIDLAAMARAQGATAFGPVEAAGDLAATFADAIAAVRGGAVAVVEVVTEAGYPPALVEALTKTRSADSNEGNPA